MSRRSDVEWPAAVSATLQQNHSIDFVASAGRSELSPRILPAGALLIVGSSNQAFTVVPDSVGTAP